MLSHERISSVCVSCLEEIHGSIYYFLHRFDLLRVLEFHFQQLQGSFYSNTWFYVQFCHLWSIERHFKHKFFFSTLQHRSSFHCSFDFMSNLSFFSALCSSIFSTIHIFFYRIIQLMILFFKRSLDEKLVTIVIIIYGNYIVSCSAEIVWTSLNNFSW